MGIAMVAIMYPVSVTKKLQRLDYEEHKAETFEVLGRWLYCIETMSVKVQVKRTQN